MSILEIIGYVRKYEGKITKYAPITFQSVQQHIYIPIYIMKSTYFIWMYKTCFVYRITQKIPDTSWTMPGNG